VCWGRSDAGQLGAQHAPVQAPVEIVGITDAVEVSTGHDFSCARRASGAVVCWGEGSEGQLGNGATNDSPTPVEVTGLTDAAELDSGFGHTCARHASGAVACWGLNSSGAVGSGDTTRANHPVDVAGVTGATFVGAAGYHSCAASPTGVSCWGGNSYAQIGNGNEEERSVTHPFAIPGVTGVTALALGDQRTCVATASEVRCWGYNNFTASLLGIENDAARNVLVPTVVPGIADATVMASGHDFSCTIRRTGALSCWGAAGSGQTGENSRTAHPARDAVPNILTLAPAASVAATFAPSGTVTVVPHIALGGSHVCTVSADGHVRCFGENQDGQLGNGSTVAVGASDAQPVPGISDAVRVVARGSTTCAVRAGGGLACWGALSDHQPNGWPVSSSLPVPIDGVTGATDVALGETTLCAITGAGTVSCLGTGRSGQLGNGATTDSPTPVVVTGIDDATHLAATANTFCALRRAGTVSCWGQDNGGECGNGGDACGATPVAVTGIDHATALDGSSRSFCAVDGGAVSCWGSDDHGQLGDGRSGGGTKAEAPVAAAGVRGASSVGVGLGVACAAGAGEAWCWGQNAFGQSGADDLGHEHDPELTPTQVHRTAEAAVGAFAGYVAADCGTNFCCGLHSDGNVSCWGSTPLGGSGGLLGFSAVRSPHPIVAPGFSAPAAPPS
jgi:alpha-tubulin suppressor-like RCC1 family protein